MFSIYATTGQVFNGTLEEMNRVHAISKTSPVRRIAGDGDESAAVVIHKQASSTNEDAVRAYLAVLPHDIERGPLYHADQIMQHNVITVLAEHSVAWAWRTLHDHRIHQAPVLNDASKIVGIVSERDLLTAINIDSGQIVESLNRRVRDVMTTPVVTASPVTDIRRIASVMLENGVDGTPITNDSERLVGFVSRSDILRAVVTDPPLSLWR